MANFYGRYSGIFGGSGGGSSETWVQEAPSGAVNGVNVTFTLAHTPTADAIVNLSLDGVTQRQGIGLEYTISGATITFATPPLAVPIAQTPWAIYAY